MKLIPAEVKSWDGVKMRIAIPGYTDGADQFPEAEICYPLADRSADTGYKILPGDPIWIMFNGGDENSPIVMGFRGKNTGGNKDTRFLEHTNFATKAENEMTETSKNHTVNAASLFTVNSNSIVLNANVKINGKLDTSGDITSSGSITDADGDGGA